MTDMMNSGSGWGVMGGLWFFSIIFWILVIAGVVLIVRWLMERDRGGATYGESPLDILKKRYARGEIDRETFERMKKDIKAGGE